MAESFKMHVFSSLLVQLCNYHIKRAIHVHCIRIDKIKSSINIHVVNRYRTSSSCTTFTNQNNMNSEQWQKYTVIHMYDPKLRLVCKQLLTTKSKIFFIEFLYLFLCILTTMKYLKKNEKKKTTFWIFFIILS